MNLATTPHPLARAAFRLEQERAVPLVLKFWVQIEIPPPCAYVVPNPAELLRRNLELRAKVVADLLTTSDSSQVLVVLDEPREATV